MALRTNALLGRGSSGGTVQVGAPAASDRSASQASAYGEFVSGVGDVTQGRVSLIILNSLVLLLVVFYITTHRSQGGG